MSDALGLLIVAVLMAASLAAFVLVLDWLFPLRLARTRTLFENQPRRAFAIGLVNLISLYLAWQARQFSGAND